MHNRSQVALGIARALTSENEELRERLAKVVRLGNFGSANDPTPGARPTRALQHAEHSQFVSARSTANGRRDEVPSVEFAPHSDFAA